MFWIIVVSAIIALLTWVLFRVGWVAVAEFMEGVGHKPWERENWMYNFSDRHLGRKKVYIPSILTIAVIWVGVLAIVT